MNIALIDIGTNSIKFLVADAMAAKEFRSLHFSRATTRLGSGLDRGGEIEPKSVEKTIEAISRFQYDVQKYHCEGTFAFSTHVLREARNVGEVLRKIEEKTGIRVKILTGEEEARFAFLSAWNRLHLEKSHSVLIDIGGGSTEFTYAKDGRVVIGGSLPLGALHLTERFLPSDPITPTEYRQLGDHIEQTIDRWNEMRQLPNIVPGDIDFVVSGGAGSALGRMIACSHEASHGPEESVRIRRDQLEGFLEECLRLPLRERRRIPGLEPDRADIIVAGLAVILAMMRKTNQQELSLNEGGVREGALWALIQNQLRWPPRTGSMENPEGSAPGG